MLLTLRKGTVPQWRNLHRIDRHPYHPTRHQAEQIISEVLFRRLYIQIPIVLGCNRY
jgi:hypothetical protein